MQVFKFGGASVKDAPSVRNVASILRQEPKDQRLIVVSAMGKTTNALEELTWAYLSGSAQKAVIWQRIRTLHEGFVAELGGSAKDEAYRPVYTSFQEIETYLNQQPDGPPDQIYDQLVSFGEIMATQIVAAFLHREGLPALWVDARRLIHTDETYREGKVNWERTCEYMTEALPELLEANLVVTQGFIGGNRRGFTTTLGREGADYSAAIFAYCLGASSVTIWKDVSGVLNADPKWFDETVLIEKLSYQDAIELAYYGATVIHPKTIKPLQNKGIPLYVRSFVQPSQPGTAIGLFQDHLRVPSFIFKINQLLISLHPRDFSFIAEDNLSRIFGVFAEAGVKINLMQNTAISFSVVVDNQPERTGRLVARLKEDFRITYNEGLELITIRYYDQPTIDRVLVNKELLLEQKSRYTAQLVVRNRN